MPQLLVAWLCVLPHSGLRELVTCNSPQNLGRMYNILQQYTNMIAKLDGKELDKILDGFY